MYILYNFNERNANMNINNKCSKCGDEMQDLVLTSYPTIHVKRCYQCGYEEKTETNIKGIVINDIKSIDLYKENELIMKITPRKEDNK